jgi:hypothetical protein
VRQGWPLPAIDIDYNRGTSKSDNERDAARMVGK